MSTTVQLFNFQGQDIRVVTINGEPHWILADVCKPLDLGDPSRVADRLDPDGTTFSRVIDSLGREQKVLCINEPNLYRTIFRSNKTEAVIFQNWVFEEVLPTVRKMGSYSAHGMNFQGLVELDPCDVKENKKLLRRVIVFYEDLILGANKKLELYKGLEEHYHPEQAKPRGRRDVHPINVYGSDENEVTLRSWRK